MKKVCISLPTEYCSTCKSARYDDRKFKTFSRRMINFVNASEYNKSSNKCDYEHCESSTLINNPIELKIDEKCKTCGQAQVTYSFCSKKCINNFVYEQIKKQQNTK